MQMHGKDHLDTYLLRVLYTLLTEQSVTRTAVKLGQSQPAISNTLKRLREITGDAILVRGKNGMVPTERGHELLALAQQSLEAMERIARPSQAFDPATTTRTFHLGAPDYLDAFFLPNIIERLRKHAPQARLIVHPLNAGVDYLAALEQGGMDLVIGNWLSPPEHLHISPLFDDEVVCMLGAQHPLARKGLSLKHYIEMPHLAPAPYAVMQRSMIDQALAEQGLEAADPGVVAVFRAGALCADAHGPGLHDRPAICGALRTVPAGPHLAGSGGLPQDALLPALARAQPRRAGCDVAAPDDRRGGGGAAAASSAGDGGLSRRRPGTARLTPTCRRQPPSRSSERTPAPRSP